MEHREKKWLPIMCIGVVFTLLSGTFSALAGYSIWRDFKSIGQYKFVTTGEVYVKESRERSGGNRRHYTTVNQPFAVFESENGKYRYEGKISVSQMNSIGRGSRYSRQLEVFIDRNGQSKAEMPQDVVHQQNSSWISLGVFSSFFVAGVGMLGLSYMRSKKSS